MARKGCRNHIAAVPEVAAVAPIQRGVRAVDADVGVDAAADAAAVGPWESSMAPGCVKAHL